MHFNYAHCVQLSIDYGTHISENQFSMKNFKKNYRNEKKTCLENENNNIEIH